MELGYQTIAALFIVACVSREYNVLSNVVSLLKTGIDSVRNVYELNHYTNLI